jgi:hypothetical protein
MHYCSFAVTAVQSEEIGSWGAESVAEEFEILDLQLALLVLVMMNQHGI